MKSPLNMPEPDKLAIRAALDTLFEPDDVIELRVLYSGRKRIDAGYFDSEHREKLVDEAIRLNKQGHAAYVPLNLIDSQLLSRCANRLGEFAESTVTDREVTRRRWLLIDIDSKRPKGTSATDSQLNASKRVAKVCREFLESEGWPDPLSAISGNGAHLLYPLDLPNDDATRDLVKGALEGLGERFNNEDASVDKSVFNAGRITKLYGTVAKKGDHTSHAPWRLSVLTGKRAETVVTSEQLAAIRRTHDTSSSSDKRSAAQSTFDLSDFISQLGIGFAEDQHNGAERYKLDRCPFNPDHGKGEAAIFRQPDGKLGFKCQHDSCSDKHWTDLRSLVEGRNNFSLSRLHSMEKRESENKFSDTRFKLTTIGDFLAEPPEARNYVVDGLLTAGGLSLLVSKPKVGKSTLSRCMALAVARGEEFLGRKSRPGLVIIFQVEGSRSELAHSLRKMVGTDEDNILIHTGQPGTFDEFAALVYEKKPILVLVDTLFKLAGVRDVNDYAETTRLMTKFEVLSRSSQAHICLLHHAGKKGGSDGDETLGSTGFFASVDTQMSMRRTSAGRVISSNQRYGTALDETVLAFDEYTEWITVAGSLKDVRIDEAQESILNEIEIGPRTESELRESISMDRRIISEALRLLMNSKIQRDGAGKKGSPYVYSMIVTNQTASDGLVAVEV